MLRHNGYVLWYHYGKETEKRTFHIPGWNWRYTGSVFVPSEIDIIGQSICVVVDPGTDSIVRHCESTEPISKIQEPMLSEERQRLHCSLPVTDGS